MKKKFLITVKTYPTISSKYEELVCTAGFLENGEFIRIYPIPFRKLDYAMQYKKYDWIEIDIEKNTSDFRPESYRPIYSELDLSIPVIDHIGTENNWLKRKKIVLNKVYEDIEKLINEAKNIGTSLAVFKPKKIIDFIYEETNRKWDSNKLKALQQFNLFEKRDNDFKVVRKLPFKFSYSFKDCNDKKCKLMIEDWEIGALYWNSLKRSNGNEEKAILKVKSKYFDDFAKTKDLYFYLGTTLKYHKRGKNPFIIIGTFHPKLDNQFSLF